MFFCEDWRTWESTRSYKYVSSYTQKQVMRKIYIFIRTEKTKLRKHKEGKCYNIDTINCFVFLVWFVFFFADTCPLLKKEENYSLQCHYFNVKLCIVIHWDILPCDIFESTSLKAVELFMKSTVKLFKSICHNVCIFPWNIKKRNIKERKKKASRTTD